MKKVIDGKLYNTDTAEELHPWTNDYYPSDFKYREKILYRTKKGSLFLYHSGGPMTDMAVPFGSGSTSGSSDIEPISEKDATRFLETHDGVDVLMKHFSYSVEEA